MSKLVKIAIMVAGIDVLFYFAGLMPSDAPTSTLMTLLLNPTNIANTTLASKAAAAFTGLVAVATIIVGFVTKDIRLAVSGPFAAYMLTVLLDVTSIIAVVFSMSPPIAIILFSPFLIAMYITSLEWALGQDQ